MPKFYKFDYAIRNQDDVIVDSSDGGESLSFTEGDGTMITGLENALLGHEAGDKFTAKLEPGEAYGYHQKQLVRTISSDMVQSDAEKIEVGMIFQVGSGSAAEVVKVIALEDNGIVVDANHPLAGLSFIFDIHVLEVKVLAVKGST